MTASRQWNASTRARMHARTYVRTHAQTGEQVGNNSSSATSTGRLWRLFMCEAFISKCTFSLRWSRSSFLPYKRLLSCYLRRRSAHLLRHNAVQRRTIFWNYFTPQAQALKIVVHILDTTSMTKRLWKHRFFSHKIAKMKDLTQKLPYNVFPRQLPNASHVTSVSALCAFLIFRNLL